MNTSDKYFRITNHPAFMHDTHIETTIDIQPHSVCPTTERIEDYEPLNTKVQYWVELIVPWYDKDRDEWCSSHEVDCDCGGWTYEEAIDNLYDLVIEKFGDYTEEDYDKRFYEIHQPSKGFFSASFKNNRKQIKPLSSIVFTKEEQTLSRRDGESYDKYKLALTTFYPTATVQQQQEIDVILKQIEHDKWVHDQEVKWGLRLV